MSRTRDWKKILAWAFLVVFVWSLTFGLIELGMRVRNWVKYGSFEPLDASLIIDNQTGLRIPTSTGRISINSMGFRSPELAIPKPSATIRFAFLGGSTTFSAEASSNEATWPHLVCVELQKTYPDISFDFVNAGVPGYTVDKSLINFEQRVKMLKPDVVVIYHATNDISYDTRQLAKEQNLYHGEVVDVSWLGQWSLAWFLIEKNLEVLARQRAAQSEVGRLSFSSEELSRGFRVRLSELVLAIKEVTPIVAIATFSHKFRHTQSSDEQLKASNTSLYYMPYMSVEGLLKAFDEYNSVIRLIAKEQGVLLIEADTSIPGEDKYFNDSVHFTDAGNRLMAQLVVRDLLNSEHFTEYVKSVISTSL